MPDPLRWNVVAAEAAVALFLLAPSSVRAHSAGALDAYGCHHDRRDGTYHCHTGIYKDLDFRSKSEMLEDKKRGLSKDEIVAQQSGGVEKMPASPPEIDEGGWASWIPFSSRSGSSDETDVVVPKGIQQRLTVLKNLHEKGLITDDDYETKRKEILGEL